MDLHCRSIRNLEQPPPEESIQLRQVLLQLQVVGSRPLCDSLSGASDYAFTHLRGRGPSLHVAILKLLFNVAENDFRKRVRMNVESGAVRTSLHCGRIRREHISKERYLKDSVDFVSAYGCWHYDGLVCIVYVRAPL